MAYHSLSAVQPFAGGDFSSDAVLAAAVASRSYEREIILLILTSPMAAWGLNFVFGLHKLKYGHYLIASQTPQHCQALGEAWAQLAQPPPPCGWATAVTHHPGWARWGLNGTHHRTALFTLRWYMSARLLDAGLNVLSLDLDGYMMADIYALLKAPPMAAHDVVVTDVGFKRGVNCGFVYFNQDAAAAAAEGGASRCSARAAAAALSAGLRARRAEGARGRALAEGAAARGGDEVNAAAVAATEAATEAAACGAPGRPWRSAANWLAHAVVERIMLFAELDELIYLGPPVPNRTSSTAAAAAVARGRHPRRHPATAVFWDAHVWCDVLRSVEEDAAVYPWGFGHAGRSDVWSRRLGYVRAQFADKFIRLRTPTRRKYSSPYAPPDEPHASRYAQLATREQALHFMPLCAPRRYRVWGDTPRAVQAAGRRGGGRACLRSGSLLLAPAWLVSQGDRPGIDWAVASPPQASFVPAPTPPPAHGSHLR